MADDIVVVDTEEEETVVDNGTSFVSSESAEIAEQAARDAKLWAEESERQALLAIGSAEDAAQAKADAVAAKEYAESAITDTNLITVATDLQSTPSNIKTVSTNISNVNAVGGNISNVNAVAGNATNINAVNSNKTNIDTVATNISDVSAVGSNISNVNAIANNETNINTVATNISDISDVSDNMYYVKRTSSHLNPYIINVSNNVDEIVEVYHNETNITNVSRNMAKINAVAADLTNINNASIYAAESKQWAIGDPTEPSGGSAKYWADTAASTLSGKQDTLVSGTNIKTINNNSILGSGNIDIQSGATYTAGIGIDITNDEISVTSPTLINTSTINSSMTIGNEAIPATSYNTLNIGGVSRASDQGCLALMGIARGFGSISIGYGARTYGNCSISIGSGAEIDNSITVPTHQIGRGTNTEAGTLYVGFKDSSDQGNNYKLLDGSTGLIPYGRIPYDNSTITVNSSGQLQAVGGGGGSSYTAGTGIDITSDVISVKYDNSTITANASGQLQAAIEAFTAAEVQTIWESV